MKKLFSILIISLAFGCASKPKGPTPLSTEDLRIKTMISDVNTKILKDTVKNNKDKKNKGTFTSFTETTYQAQLKKSKGPSAKELSTILPLFKTKEFIGSKNTYVFCGFSERLRIAFCDDALCSETEFFAITENANIIQKWKTQLPLKTCNISAK